MKSRPYVPYLVLGVAALLLWLAGRAGNRPAAVRPTPPAVAQATPRAFPRAVVPTPNPPTPVDVSGGGPPAESSSPVGGGGTTPGQARDVASGSAPVEAPGAAVAVNQTAQIDVGRVRHMISDFHTLAGENPVGTNAEIMKQMMGGNSRQATLGPPEGMPLNAQGELVDQWGSPYFFHQLSRDKMEVRSAGPDKVMWTADDVIAR